MLKISKSNAQFVQDKGGTRGGLGMDAVTSI